MDVKTRHYQQLSHQLGKLQENISQSNQQFKIAAEQLQQMQKLSISHASQFMAVSKIIDKQETEM
ncbi:hypothetical protein E3P77_01694 [Wallemia ichthyophaga]|uniref:Uncharacterized protein n=1 Tax=Wallemia ichthyophaga (strain EXF-994 / CBS 113033) TaxID=1299270 RepID=R9AIE4_WALI9|nr:uncharacterized protein J056_003561 [Wallemia ichthyophaga EXF-994]EOR01885.1 hypothetical protein J056_003561 [Wallemia ichthyophaga EXF-994]TIB67349.1 hypothetical protein E3P77_01694 [Wallemia ichthyophaga]